MRKRFRMDYLNQIYHRYHKSNSTDKSKMLDEFCKVCGYVRKYAIRKLNAPLPDNHSPKPAIRGNRKKMYLKETITMLEIMWKATNYLCSVRLHAAIPIWLPHLRNQYHLSQKVSEQLLTISPSTIDRTLKDKKQKLKRKLYGTTKPGSLLKHQIPIKTGPWDTTEPGFAEVDLVSHSGNSGDGDFIHSCNITDILSAWTETRAIRNKGQLATLEAIRDIQNELPFKLRGIDSDNGSEFINYHLLKYCLDHNIDFTRSRPYKKDDNAHVEQKNWTCVRKLFGYLRYDSPEALDAMNDLYRNELKLLQNLFLPSQKLLKKVRVGSRYIRKYDNPLTPLQRLHASKSKNLIQAKLKRFTELFSSLNPFMLSAVIDNKINAIYKLASRTRNSKNQSLKVAA
jgi:hypothetical protein